MVQRLATGTVPAMSRTNLTFSLLALSILGASMLGACSDGEESQEEEHGHGDPVEECSAISLVCHDVDALSDLAAECHDLAHDNHAEDCIERQDECISHCESLAGAGGAGGEGGDHH